MKNSLRISHFSCFKIFKIFRHTSGSWAPEHTLYTLRIKLDYPLGNISHFNFPLLIVDKCLLKPTRVHGLVVAKNGPLCIRRLAWSVLSLALKWW